MGAIVAAVVAALGIGAVALVATRKKKVGAGEGGGRGGDGGGGGGGPGSQPTPYEAYIAEAIRQRNSGRGGSPGVAVTADIAILQNRAALDAIGDLFPFERRGIGTCGQYQNPLCAPNRTNRAPATTEEYVVAARQGVELLARHRPIAMNDGSICPSGIVVWGPERRLRQYLLDYETSRTLDVGDLNREFQSVLQRNANPTCVDIGMAGWLGML